MVKNKKLRLRKIYTKFLLMTITVIILASIVSGIFMARMVYNTLTDMKIDEIKDSLDDLTSMTEEYLKSFDRETGELSFEANWGAKSDQYYYNLIGKMETYYEMMGFTVFVADKEGTIQMTFPLLPGTKVPSSFDEIELEEEIILNLNYYDGTYHFKNQSNYEKSLENHGQVENKSDFYGLFNDTKENYVTVSQNIEYYNKEAKQWDVAGSVVIALPVPELAKAEEKIVKIFVLSTLILIVIATIAIMIFTRNITEPVKKLENAAKKVAKGEFSEKIEKTTDDELGQLVDSFNRMSESIQRMDSVKTEFISNVSHELRTPITSVKGFIEAILDGVIPEEKYEYYLKLCFEEMERMNNLINELLDMTRIEFAKSNMFEVFDINQLITNQIIKMEPQISEKKIDVDLNFESDKQFVCAGKASILRVVINLVHNATKFTKEGGNITISVKRSGEKVEVSVADTGIGIADEEVGKVFERFYKSDKSRGMDKTGTGLGLAIVKKILDSHGETIECQSKLGEGTTFIFTLSAAEEPENNGEDIVE